jgi:S-DNA-T family DNA segregation ATPase FtsK/SpoIIIE
MGRTPDHLLKAQRDEAAIVPDGGAMPEGATLLLEGLGAIPALRPSLDDLLTGAAPVPSWLRPFTMASNARFTRTPDYMIRGRDVPAQPALPAVAADAEPVVELASTPEVAADSVPEHQEPALPLDTDGETAASQADEGDCPRSLRGLANLIQIGAGPIGHGAGEQDNRRPVERAAEVAPVPVQAFFPWPALTVSVQFAPMWPSVPAMPATPPAATVQPAEAAILLPEPAEAPAPAIAPPAASTPAIELTPAAAGWSYELPPLELLAEVPAIEPCFELSEEYLEKNSVTLQQTLHDFGVRGQIIDANPGPVVTLYELEPAPGTKSSRVISVSSDIARSMSAVSARVAVIEGRNVIGIELPNPKRETVYLRELLETADFSNTKQKLAVCLGKTIGGEPVIADLARMPHLLVAGTTGSGKSVAINTMILSLLYMHKPEQCRLIMVDPKMLELSVYDGIPHLLTPVVTDPKKAVVALKWAVREMEERYKKMSKLSVRNIDGYNTRMAEARERGEVITRTVQTGFDRETGEIIYTDEVMDLDPLPYIVIVVDEMADLMMVAGKDIEGAIQRLAQMARAAGIHLIMATQRPSVDVITGTIKANFPTRISFQVTSKIDSRTILGEMGAEQLLGQGDMLYMQGGGRIQRVHGPFVSDGEVEKVVAHLKRQGQPEYLDSVTASEDEEAPAAVPAITAAATEETAVFDRGNFGEESAEIYDQAIAVVMRDRKASTSYIQRRLGIGYNRAASIMERMEKEGIVGSANHAGKREILADIRPHGGMPDA